MSRHLLTLLIPALLLASCTYQRPVSSTVATTEEDDYYTSTELEQRRSAWLRDCPDYFENRFMPGTFNQLYNPYSWNNPVCANSFLNSGFNNFQPGWYLTWHPAYGWHFAWVSGYMPMNWGNFASTGGWYSGWNNYCNWGWAYDPFNTWSSGYDPWFDPYCYNYSGYNYGYSPWDYCGGDSYYWINNYYTTNNTYVYSNGDTPGDDVPGGNGDIPSIALQQFNALPGHDDTGGKQPVAIGNKPETGIPGKSHPSIWVSGSADNGKGEDEEEDDDDEYVTPTFRNPVRPTSEPDEVQRPAEKPKPSWSQPEEEKPAYSPPQRNNPEPRPEPARPSAPKPTTSATKKGGR